MAAVSHTKLSVIYKNKMLFIGRKKYIAISFYKGDGKMIKKLYKWAAVIMSVKIGIEAHSFHEMFTALFYFFAMYLVFKVFFAYLRNDIRSSGGLFRWLIHSADTTRHSRPFTSSIENSMYSWFGTGTGCSAQNNKREADQRVFNRTKAQNEAMFHQYYADKNKGTYDGYRSQNWADEARNRANRY